MTQPTTRDLHLPSTTFTVKSRFTSYDPNQSHVQVGASIGIGMESSRLDLSLRLRDSLALRNSSYTYYIIHSLGTTRVRSFSDYSLRTIQTLAGNSKLTQPLVAAALYDYVYVSYVLLQLTMPLKQSIIDILSDAQCGVHDHQKLLRSLRYVKYGLYVAGYMYMDMYLSTISIRLCSDSPQSVSIPL